MTGAHLLWRARWLLGAAVVVFGELGFWLHGIEPRETFPLDLAVSSSSIVAGLVLWERRPGNRTGPLLVLAGVLWALPGIGAYENPIALGFSVWLGGGQDIVFAHLLIAYPSGRVTSRLQRALVVTAYSVFLLKLAQAMTLSTIEPSRNAFEVWDAPGIHDALGHVADGIAFALALAGLGIVGGRWRRASSAARRLYGPVLAAGGVFALSIVLSAAITVFQDPEPDWSFFLGLVARLGIPAAFLYALLRSRLERVAVADLVLRLTGSTGERMQEALARALHDPSLELVHWSAGSSAFVDAAGVPLELPGHSSARSATVIEGSDGPLAALIHDASIQEEATLLASVAAAVRLGIENRQFAEEVSLSRTLPGSLARSLQQRGHRTGETELVEVTILMSDLRGYSTIAEHSDPSALALQLNEHRSEMSPIIANHGGTVMQFVGDAVFAVFGAPVPIANHAARALAAAREMHGAQTAINARWLKLGFPSFDLAVGLSSGQVAAALLGSEELIEYSLVGDVVNLSHRLQQWAQQGEIVLSELTFRQGGAPADAEPIDPAKVKGRQALVNAYRVRAGALAEPTAV